MSRHGERLSASDIRNRCACMMLPESARVVMTRPRIRVSGADFRSAFLVFVRNMTGDPLSRIMPSHSRRR
jgi:hypothetical protein